MLAFIFPGQGSQRTGMGTAWMEQPSFEIVDEAGDILKRDIRHLLLNAPPDDLKDTANAQIATFVMSLVVLDSIERIGLSPTWCAGHSLGEYTALVAGGYMSFEDGLGLVQERGDAMRVAGERHPGTMAALMGIGDQEADTACRLADDDVWVANFNAPGQVVISGSHEGVRHAIEIAKSLGARKALELQVSGAFHTPLMAEAKDRLRKAIAGVTWETSEVPVVANVDAMPHDNPAQWPTILSAQLTNPVRWHQSLTTLSDLGAACFIEVGPGGVLSGLARRVLPEHKVISAGTPDDVANLIEEIAGNELVSHHGDNHAGESLTISEKLIVTTVTGIFKPRSDLAGVIPGPGASLPRAASPVHDSGNAQPDAISGGGTGGPPAIISPEGTAIGVGEEIGYVGDAPVMTPFEGNLVGFLAHANEKVVAGQPVAWMRTKS